MKTYRISTLKKFEGLPKLTIFQWSPVFQDEVIAALAMSDGVVLLVDCVVGLTQSLGLVVDSCFLFIVSQQSFNL